MPRFRMQVVLGGRRFPVAEASSKKTSKKDAAAVAMRVLLREAGGGGGDETPGNHTHSPENSAAPIEPVSEGEGGREVEGVGEEVKGIHPSILDKVAEADPDPVQSTRCVPIGKNPVSMLMEYGQKSGNSCEFLSVSQSGPAHDPRFRMQVVLGGRRFPVAEASSKKTSKKDAAAVAMRVLLREAGGGGGDETPGNHTHSPENSAAPIEPVSEGEGGREVEGVGEEVKGIHPSILDKVAEADPDPVQSARCVPIGKNPVSMLMEYGQKSGNSCEFLSVSQSGPAHDPRFTFRVRVGEQLFPPVVANNKKLARQLSAEAAVQVLMEENPQNFFTAKSSLFQLFRAQCSRAGRGDLLALPSYRDAKQAAQPFQRAKESFVRALQDMSYGNWICKPVEEKSFSYDEV
ncbi:UNVERIFIED_CONTAM: hypothetical protein FKN15_009061 [Acipenser sinensis]